MSGSRGTHPGQYIGGNLSKLSFRGGTVIKQKKKGGEVKRKEIKLTDNGK